MYISILIIDYNPIAQNITTKIRIALNSSSNRI